MIAILVWSLLLVEPQPGNRPPEHVQKYLTRCADAYAAAIHAKQEEIKSLIREPIASAETKAKLRAAENQLKQLQEQPPALLPLTLPPRKGDLGIFQKDTAEGLRTGLIDVLEVVDRSNAIIRAWYPLGDGEATFVDLWAKDVDTSGMTAGSPATLTQVFHVVGNKSFDTTCGGRSLPLVEPFDIAPYR